MNLEVEMRRLTMLIVLFSLIAVVSNASDFTLLSREEDAVRAFLDFSTWIVASSLLTGTGALLGLLATSDQENSLAGVIVGGSIGFGTALTISLLSSSGESTSEKVLGHVVPVVIGVPAAIIVIPAVFVWFLLEAIAK